MTNKYLQLKLRKTTQPINSSLKDEMNIEIRQAKQEDAATVSAILNEAATYLESIHQPLWKLSDWAVEIILPDVVSGMYYLASMEKASVGVFKYQLEDKMFWPEITDDRSAFVHRVAIIRTVAGKGVSAMMLNWAKNHTRNLGRDYLRLDCAARQKLCAVYEKTGFIKHSEKQVGRFHVVRYECDVRYCQQAHAEDTEERRR